jgi:hypothetical protein
MALTKLPKNAIADDAVNADKIADGTIQNQDVLGSISNDKLANSSFTINGTSVSLGASQSIVPYLDWQAVQVADGSTQVNAEVNKGYFLDTNAGVIEVFLPTSPSRGDVVGLVDYAGTFGTNQLIINTGGINIDSTATGDVKVTTNNAIVECVYVDSAKGWLIYLNQAAGTTPTSVVTNSGTYNPFTHITATGGTITTSGDYKIHTFTGDGCFVVTYAGAGTCAAPSVVDYLVVAGGGGGGWYSGSGGAGGFRVSNSTSMPAPLTSPLATPTGITISSTTYPITVGAGGSGGFNSPTPTPKLGGVGSNSTFSTITSAGGGPGRNSMAVGVAGGSGSGGVGSPGPGASGNPGGAGNTPPTSPPQGNNGGQGYDGWVTSTSGGGGGGAGAVGSNAGSGAGGNGGSGSYVLGTGFAGCNGTTGPVCGSRYFAGGGGGGTDINGTAGTGGTGGGGAGAHMCTGSPGVSGTANTGGGGGSQGGCNSHSAGAGGKGIVIIRYKFQ